MEMKFQHSQNDRGATRYFQKRKMIMAAFRIIDENPEITMKEIAEAVKNELNLSKPPMIDTVARWVSRRKQIERQGALREHVEKIVFIALHKKTCHGCLNEDPYSGRCCFGYEAEAEIIDILAGKVFCYYYQKRGKME